MMLPVSEEQWLAFLGASRRLHAPARGSAPARRSGTPRAARASSRRRADARPERVELVGVEYVTIPARDLRRSVDFYARVFGLELVQDATASARPHLLMRDGGVHLALHPCVNGVAARHRWTFAVRDLDRARELLWNFGVRVADTAETARPAAQRFVRSLRIREPDGHEIELVESAAQFGVSASVDRGEPSRRDT